MNIDNGTALVCHTSYHRGPLLYVVERSTKSCLFIKLANEISHLLHEGTGDRGVLITGVVKGETSGETIRVMKRTLEEDGVTVVYFRGSVRGTIETFYLWDGVPLERQDYR